MATAGAATAGGAAAGAEVTGAAAMMFCVFIVFSAIEYLELLKD